MADAVVEVEVAFPSVACSDGRSDEMPLLFILVRW